MSRIIDARGMACPQPVLQTKKALQTEGDLIVIVDNRAARENVTRLSTKLGCKVQVEEKSDGIYLHITREGGEPAAGKAGAGIEAEYITCSTGELVLFIASDTLGSGDDELGGILMRAFMHTFLEVEPRPDTIILINGGVKLAVSGSPVLEDLQSLANEGVRILICGTCLNFFDITNKMAVGEISNAYTIAETLLQAGKVIRF